MNEPESVWCSFVVTVFCRAPGNLRISSIFMFHMVEFAIRFPLGPKFPGARAPICAIHVIYAKSALGKYLLSV